MSRFISTPTINHVPFRTFILSFYLLYEQGEIEKLTSDEFDAYKII